VLLSRMSGSGATCFGLCDRPAAAAAAARALADQHADWWIEAGSVAADAVTG
jgi:4-diphosphocytidyl-2-C-methyl-D-erythritol kinase